MPRIARAVLVGVPHHLTQRGTDRQVVFGSEADHEIYLALVSLSARRFGTQLQGYCLMPNHVHWVVTPTQPNSLARTFGEAHGRYATFANAKRTRCGHFWQNRFFSCAMDNAHLWAAMRYVERNPVRAGMIDVAADYRWSSAAVHSGLRAGPSWLDPEPMRSTYTTEQWDDYLRSDTIADEELRLRKNTFSGRPAGSREFTECAEGALGRCFKPRAAGRPRKADSWELVLA